MKFNRNKMGLVVVVMILALTPILSGCTPPAGNQTPDFLRVGGSYKGMVGFGGWEYEVTFTVVKMRRDGWILIEPKDAPDRYGWLNTAQLVGIAEIGEMPR